MFPPAVSSSFFALLSLILLFCLSFPSPSPSLSPSHSDSRSLSSSSSFFSLSFLSPISCQTTKGDLYEILGIKRDASDSDIKKAYRRLSLQYHPDKNPNDDVIKQRYMDIQYANEVLSDPDKRQTYDIDGHEGLEAEKNGQQRGGGGGIFDLFGFGGGGAGGKRKGPDYRMQYDVTLEDLYNGGNRQFKIARKVLCKSCRGSGAKDGKTTQCPYCKGKGHVMTLQP